MSEKLFRGEECSFPPTPSMCKQEDFLSKDLPKISVSKDEVQSVIQQLNLGILSPSDLDQNALELILKCCTEQNESRQGKRETINPEKNSVVPGTFLKQNRLTASKRPWACIKKPESMNSLATSSSSERITEFTAGTVFHAGSVVPPNTGRQAFHGSISAPEVIQPGVFLASKEGSKENFKGGLFQDGSRTRISEKGKSVVHSFDSGTNAPKFMPSGLGRTYSMPERLMGIPTEVSNETMMDTVPASTDTKTGISVSFNTEMSIPQSIPQRIPSESGTAFTRQGSTGFETGEFQAAHCAKVFANTSQELQHMTSISLPSSLTTRALECQKRAAIDSRSGKTKRERTPVHGPGNESCSDMTPFKDNKHFVLISDSKTRKDERLMKNRANAQQARERKVQQMLDLENHCCQVELQNIEMEKKIVHLQMENKTLLKYLQENNQTRG